MTKLIYEGYLKWLQECEDEGIRQFKEEIDKDSAMWIEKYEASKRDWEVEVAAWGKYLSSFASCRLLIDESQTKNTLLVHIPRHLLLTLQTHQAVPSLHQNPRISGPLNPRDDSFGLRRCVIYFGS